MFVVTVLFEVKPEALEAFMPLVMENARTTLLKERGCQRFDVCRDEKNPTRVFLYEIYNDQAAFKTHLRTSHFLSFTAATNLLVTEKTVESWERLDPGTS